MPLSIYNKTTPLSFEKKIINTSMFIRGHIVLVFSALISLFVVTLFSVLFIV